ncbi:MAG: FeoA family protein [Cyclobacteriaceae bacterium]
MTTHQKTLADLKPGQTAVIAGFDNPEFANKLLEMGFLPGTAIRFNYRAPLGDPVCVSVGSYDLSIRLAEASTIYVLE